MEMLKINKLLSFTAICSALLCSIANAKEIDTNMARMQAMDKITGRVSVIDVPVNGEVIFESFSINVRACKTRPPEEAPENFAFVDVVDQLNEKSSVNVFKGWMLSSSPALNAVEHPIYDVWLIKCIDGKVDASKLLTSEQLKDRDALPKASDFKDAEEKKIPAEIIKQSDAETKISPEVTETTNENVVIDKVPEVKLDVDDIAIEQAPVNDGAPKSLINLEAVESEPKQIVPVADAPIAPVEIISEIDAELTKTESTAPVEDKTNVDEVSSIIEETIGEIEKSQETAPQEPIIAPVDLKTESAVPASVNDIRPAIDESSKTGQLIDFSEEIPEEDGFELNTEALTE